MIKTIYYNKQWNIYMYIYILKTRTKMIDIVIQAMCDATFCNSYSINEGATQP